VRFAFCLALLSLCAASRLEAQGVRGTAVSSARTIELRPLRTDTIDPVLPGDSAQCGPGPRCIVLVPGERETAVALMQDVRLTAWGFGVPGLSATAFLRARADIGNGPVWPRSNDAFDALLAYVEYDREPVRMRLGRQRTAGGLGFASYDGLSVLVQRGPRLFAELYGGRSLARGLVEPRSEVLQGFEDFVPDASVLLIGGTVGGEPLAGLSAAIRYQREIFADRGALVSERASGEATLTAFAPLRLSASADWDFAFGRAGKADVRAMLPLPRGFRVEAAGRRYVPYFELWTIWGFFDPVAWHEAETRVVWSRPGGGGPVVGVSAALRRYDETETGILGPEQERDTRLIALNANWDPAERWTLDASYHLETGFGASFGGGDLSVRWSPARDAWVRAFVTAFEQLEEFRVGEGSVVGGGAAAEIPLSPRLSVGGGFSLYRHASTRATEPDWNQRRAWLSLRVGFGSDPALMTARRSP
jgi:hypothetical protein